MKLAATRTLALCGRQSTILMMLETHKPTAGLVFMPAWLPFAPPLGITAVAAYLKKHDIDVQLFDFNGKIWKEHPDHSHYWKMSYGGTWSHVEKYKKDIHPKFVQSLVSAAHELMESGAKTLGFSIYSSNYLPTRFVIKIIRMMRPDIKIHLGGAAVDKRLAEQDLKENLIDAAVFNEGEQASLKLLKYWAGEIPFAELKGVAIRNPDGEICFLDAHPQLKMEELPVPDFSFFDFDHYYGKALPLEFARGCTANCTFCSETNYWKGFRVKKVEQVIEEMKNHIEKYGIREFRVVDSLMNGHFKFLEILLDRLIEEKLDVNWYGFCRIDKRMTPELLKKMRAAGCTSISFGLESGSQKVLDLMNKRVSIGDTYKVVTATHEAGIHACAEILMGFPGETIIDVAKTYLMIYKLRKKLHTITTGTTLEVVENSELRANPEKFNVVYKTSENWRTKTYLNNPWTRKYLLSFTNFWVELVGVKLGYPQIR